MTSVGCAQRKALETWAVQLADTGSQQKKKRTKGEGEKKTQHEIWCAVKRGGTTAHKEAGQGAS